MVFNKINNFFLLIILLICSIFSNTDDFYQKEFDFAKNLISEGEYDRAITSLKRLNSFYPNNPNKLDNLSLISKCYYLNQKYIESNNISRSILEIDKTNWNSIVNSIKSFQNLNYYYESNLFIDKHKGYFNNDKLDTLILSSAINHIFLYEIDQARNKLKDLKINSSLNKEKLNFLKLINEEYPLEMKSKKIATLYSIVPGGGYVYTNHYQTALSAFIVNLLFYKATYDAYKTGNDGIGHFCSFLNFSFYFGSMTGSWQLVDKHNKKLKRDFANKFIIY